MANPFDSTSIDSAVAANPPTTDSTTIQQPIQKYQTGVSKGLIGAMLAGTLADAASTNISMGRGNVEYNPLLSKNRWLNSAEIGLSGAGLALLANKLGHSHPTLAKILGGGSIGLSGVDTLNNIATMSNR